MPLSRLLLPLVLLIAPAAARAEDTRAFTLGLEYTADLAAVAQGPATGTRYVDYIGLDADLALDRLAGLEGTRLHATVIAATGRRPNDLAGTLQGVNNIEVPTNRVRLFELYVEQQLGRLPASVRLGFTDLNAEFYANDSAGLLLGPAFGIGSELAATGPNGPSIFPSTAMTARLRVDPSPRAYAEVAAVNAEAGVLGDPGSVRPLLRSGVLLIGEAGWTGSGHRKIAGGAWTYTHRQDDLRDTAPAGDPAPRRAWGVYGLFEVPLLASDHHCLDAFLRIGRSDGNTTPYAGGWQAGVFLHPVLTARPESRFSLGVNQARLSRKFRQNAADAGQPMARAETGAEVTFSDALTPWLSVQPDAQYVWNAARSARDALVLTLRLTITPTLF